MVTMFEMIIPWYPLPYDFHMIDAVQFNDGAIDKGSGTKELARTIKIFENGNTRSGVKLLSLRDIPGLQVTFSDKVTPDNDYFTSSSI